jgi:hypothetical protein
MLPDFERADATGSYWGTLHLDPRPEALRRIERPGDG